MSLLNARKSYKNVHLLKVKSFQLSDMPHTNFTIVGTSKKSFKLSRGF